jgi:hypothetical protein
MAWLGAFLGLVALAQGVAWLGGADVGRRRKTQGAVLAPAGLLMLLLSLLHLLVPHFFG